ncbi:MAG: hypothetical protein GY791_12670 [Alphaproteobacteria bacterium]|nr:hypothetical protein [Alphaproteobacteria bacterium]
MELTTNIDDRVSLEVTAQNAKAGAIVMTDDGEVIYVKGMKAWDDGVLDRRLSIEGVLRQGKVYPDPKGEGAFVSQGMRGTQYVLEMETYRVL